TITQALGVQTASHNWVEQDYQDGTNNTITSNQTGSNNHASFTQWTNTSGGTITGMSQNGTNGHDTITHGSSYYAAPTAHSNYVFYGQGGDSNNLIVTQDGSTNNMSSTQYAGTNNDLANVYQ